MKNEKEEILDFYKDVQKMTIKRACEKDGKIGITVSGVPKKKKVLKH